MALRYLRGVRGRASSYRFLRFMTYVAVGGVAVGVAALLLALSITRGFSVEIEHKIVSFGAHVQVENIQDAPLSESDSLSQRLAALPGVVKVLPVVQELALLRSSTQIDGVGIWGTPADNTLLHDHMVEGAFRFEPDEAGHPGLVLSKRLAQFLGVEVGDVLTGFSMRNAGGGSGGGLQGLLGRPRVRQFHVAGIFDTGLVEFDELYAFTGLPVARGLLGYRPDEVTRFDVLLDDIARSDEMALTIEAELGFPILARSIFQVYRNLFDWIKLQQSIIPLVIGVIILVAAINIVGILLMMILEKTREIGVLRSMGATARTVKRVYLWLGLMIGMAGLLVGEALALGLALLQQRYGLIPVPEETYYMTTAPIDLSMLDFVTVALVTLPLCALAAYIPARVASRTDPVRSIRFAT